MGNNGFQDARKDFGEREQEDKAGSVFRRPAVPPHSPETSADMLCLTRNLNESIVIDGGIVVRVLSVVGNRVRLGVDAPKNIKVDREEVAERRQRDEREKRSA